MAEVIDFDPARPRSGKTRGHLYTTGKNEPTETVSARVPERLVRALDELLASRLTPFRTRSDALRQAMFLFLEYIDDVDDNEVQEMVATVLRAGRLATHLAFFEIEERILEDCKKAVEKARQWKTPHLAEVQIRAAAEDSKIPEIKAKLLALLREL